MILPYGQEIKDQHTKEVYEAYVEALDKYIWTQIMVPGKDYIPVLTKDRGRKRYHSSNLFGKPNNNPIIETIESNVLPGCY